MFTMVKYIKGNTIELEKKASELAKWKELEKTLHHSWEKYCEKDQKKWIELSGSEGRTYECFLSEVETTIENLGG